MNKEKLIEKIKQHKKKITLVLIALLLIGGGSIYALSNNSNSATSKNAKQSEMKKDEDKSSDDKTNDDTKSDEKLNDDNTSSDNEDTKKDTSTSINNSNNNDNSSSNKPADKPADKPSGGDKPTHSHSWEKVYKTVNHPEQGHTENVLVKEGWTEQVPVYELQMRVICRVCAEDITEDMVASGGESYTAHAAQKHPGRSGWKDEQRNIQVGAKPVYHEPVYESRYIIDKAASSEQVLDHYKCSCGATK